jgi:hypothetical protein
MAIRIVPDEDKPSIAIEIPLEKPLPDYDLEELEKPTPRDVDGILVSQGFRDLVDDARGVLTELLHPSALEIVQFTGAICPADDDVYRPGLWIVVRDPKANPKAGLPKAVQEQLSKIAAELTKRVGV